MNLREFTVHIDDDRWDHATALLNAVGQVVSHRPVCLATEAEIERAREMYAYGSGDDIEIDTDAHTSPTDDGTWVQAWVWLPREEVHHEAT